MSADKKSILFFTGGTYVGGQEIMVLQLMVQLQKDGYNVYCIVNGWNDGAYKSMLEQQHIKYFEVKLGWVYITKLLWTLDTLWHFPRAYYKIRKVLKDIAPDIIHFHNYASYIALYPLIKTKCLYTLHEEVAPSRKHTWVYKMMNKKISVFVTVSEFTKQCLLGQPVDRNKIDLVYNGIEMPGIAIDRQARTPVVFGIVGQVINGKGHDLVIKAAKMLVDKKYPFKVKIFGNTNTSFAHTLKKQISDLQLGSYFEWIGFINNKYDIYEQVDVILVPSELNEALSLTKMEGMYYHCPVIVSNKGGNPELVTDGEDGFIFDINNVAMLQGYMEKFINDAGLIKKMGDNAHIHIRPYSTIAMTNKYKEIYNKI